MREMPEMVAIEPWCAYTVRTYKYSILYSRGVVKMTLDCPPSRLLAGLSGVRGKVRK